jgi:hypothetical protein
MKIIETYLKSNEYYRTDTQELLQLPRVSHLIGGGGSFTGSTHSMVRGTNVHAIISKYISGGILLKFLRELAEVEENYKVALKMIKALQSHLEGIDYTYCFVELSFGVEYDNGAGYAGTIDLVIDVAEGDKHYCMPVDFKTGEPSPKHKLQLEYYINALSAKTGLVVYEDGTVVTIEAKEPEEIKHFVESYFSGNTKGGKLTELADIQVECELADYYELAKELESIQEKVEAKKEVLKALLSEKNITQVGSKVTAHYQPPKLKRTLKKDVLNALKKELERDDVNMEQIFIADTWLFRLNKEASNGKDS